MEAAKIQGFKWSQSKYEFSNGKGKPKSVIEMKFDENTYLILALRYKELFGGGGESGIEDVPFEIDGHLMEIDTGVIDADYMNSRFEKYLKILGQDGIDTHQMQQTLDELHKLFAFLSQEEQKYANIFLHDVQRGDVTMESYVGIKYSKFLGEYSNI